MTKQLSNIWNQMNCSPFFVVNFVFHDVGILFFCMTMLYIAWHVSLIPWQCFIPCWICMLHAFVFMVNCVNVLISPNSKALEHVFILHYSCDWLIDLESSRCVLNLCHGVLCRHATIMWTCFCIFFVKDLQRYKRRVRRRVNKMKAGLLDACSVKILTESSGDEDEWKIWRSMREYEKINK